MIKIELTEQQRDILWQIIKTLCIVPNPVYESLRDQLYPKKYMVEFDMSDAIGRRDEYFRVQIVSGRILISDSKNHNTIEFDRSDFEKLIELYNLKKHEVADE